MLDRIQHLNDELFGEIVQLRRTIHQHPELALEEEQTAQLVIDTLRPLGLDLQTGIVQTGVVATLQGAHPGPTRLLRADMDALPIHEATGLPFASQHPGKMHACGHDVHTASLLGAALILHRLRDDLHGAVRFLFQPSEEVIPGGAKPMIEEGVLQDHAASPAPTTAFGQHVMPELPAGQIGVCSGMYMASADEIEIAVTGRGGHGATPHEIGPDTVLAAAHIVVALQSVISRNCPPGVPSVLSIGRVVADGAHNVIPPVVQLWGTFRAMDETWRFRAHERIREVVHQTAATFGATAEVHIKVGYPALYNHEEPTAFVREAAVEYVGAANTVDLDLWFAAEDFAWYLREVPGSFYRLGVGNEARGIVHGLHTPKMDSDEEALRVGPGFMAYLAWKRGLERTNDDGRRSV